MAALPSVSGEGAVRVFQKAGWVKDRQRGSHVILIKPGHAASLSVPQTSRNSSGNAAGVDPRGGDVGGRIRCSGVNRGYAWDGPLSIVETKYSGAPLASDR
jgi:predicted RNA binding protein YcfA (HicA-like mRNA interferase family)